MKDAQVLIAYMSIVMNLIDGGRTTWARLRHLLAATGATDEELSALDVRLSDAIATREAER